MGAVAGVAAAILGVLVAQRGWSGLPGIIVALTAGAAMGLLQGVIVVWARVPSFVATLAGLLSWQGVQLILPGSTGELLIRKLLVRSLASGYLTPTQGVAVAMAVLLGVAVVIWRRRASRKRTGLEIAPLLEAITQFGIWGAALALGVAACNSYFGVPYVVLVLGTVVAALSWFTERTVTGPAHLRHRQERRSGAAGWHTCGRGSCRSFCPHRDARRIRGRVERIAPIRRLHRHGRRDAAAGCHRRCGHRRHQPLWRPGKNLPRNSWRARDWERCQRA